MNEQEQERQEKNLNDLLNNPATSIQELVNIVENDKELAELVLAKANTAIYGLRRRVTSLREAVVLIGFRSLRDLAIRRTTEPPTVERELEM